MTSLSFLAGNVPPSVTRDVQHVGASILKNSIKHLRSGAIALSLVSPLAYGDAPSEWEIGLGAESISIQEKANSGQRLVEESGAVPSLFASIAWPHETGIFDIGGSASVGDLAYEGHTQSGRAVNSRTDYQFAHLHWNYLIGPPEGLMAGIGMRGDWRKRRIQAVDNQADLLEEYGEAWLAVRGHYTYPIASGEIKADMSLFRLLGGRETVKSADNIDRTSLNTGKGHGIDVGIAWISARRSDYCVRTHWRLHWTTITTARSKDVEWHRNGMPAGTLAQPETRRQYLGLSLSAIW